MPNDDNNAAGRPWRVYAAEMLGTGVLVFLGCGSVISNSMSSGAAGLVGVAASFGLAVAIMIYAVGPISGCHINPAVTIALAATGRLPRKQILPYVGAQATGAVLASLLHMVLFTAPVAAKASFGATTPAVAPAAALGFELVATFILMFVIMSFAANPHSPAAMAAVGIGAVVLVDIIVCGPATGASLNPARSFGPALFAGGAALSSYWIYVLGPIAGAVLAGLAYEALNEHRDEPEAVAVVEESVPAGSGRK